jgi:hypothetical protein
MFDITWEFKSGSSRLWRHVVLWQDTNVTEGRAVSIFTVKMKTSWTTLRGVTSSEDLDLNLHRRDNLKARNIWEARPNLLTKQVKSKSHDGSVGIAPCYGLDDRDSRVRFPAGAGNFSLHHRVQPGSGAHPVSYPMGTRGSFPGSKAAGAWSWPLTSI